MHHVCGRVGLVGHGPPVEEGHGAAPLQPAKPGGEILPVGGSPPLRGGSPRHVRQERRQRPRPQLLDSVFIHARRVVGARHAGGRPDIASLGPFQQGTEHRVVALAQHRKGAVAGAIRRHRVRRRPPAARVRVEVVARRRRGVDRINQRGGGAHAAAGQAEVCGGRGGRPVHEERDHGS
jgi:hypothetical protein